ncbi:hypothetical protein [Pusillimonas noertemannii]|uniref:Uncharacterized protein n=1 Tax=Pusillimonas noertemannii TaxID=305977 RepID=A0A2U1CIP3_9BURK|nr:hypothetical protein [Pusillimonas noertemannii]NYT70706.1 hypothetical protein [Pusillimonas noertemannii]PVY60863.1 hypothetical protein C7440_3367 [Pusillimonas noertemannii]TFL08541.1 hypothetical protein CSC72_16135 [Pusillimonas noertemannii]
MSVVTIDDTAGVSRGKATSLVSIAATLFVLILKEFKHALGQGEPLGIIQSQLASKTGNAIVYECDSWIGWTSKNLD